MTVPTAMSHVNSTQTRVTLSHPMTNINSRKVNTGKKKSPSYLSKCCRPNKQVKKNV